jgi:hypothetical protein
MIKNNGKNQAGNLSKNSAMVMIVSILAVSMFIGIAFQPAIASSVSKEEKKAEIKQPLGPDPSCDSCAKAVAFSIEYMVNHVKSNLNGVYFLWSVDATILIFQGLILGLQQSGFKPEINEMELKATVHYWVKKLVGPQIFTTTKLLAKIGAVGIGITGYLLSLCNNDGTQTTSAYIEQFNNHSPVRIISWMIWSFLVK